MADQLALIDTMDIPTTAQAGGDLKADQGWRLDAATCEAGLRGVAAARKALRAARVSAGGGNVGHDGLAAAA